jgi:molecular chaperone HscB
MNYFKIFEVEESFIVDLNKLEDLYLKKQSLFHPDKFIAKDEKCRLEALEKTIVLNKAYDVLKSDTNRAFHLLQLQGLEVDLEENVVDIPEILSEIFEEREGLEFASSIDQLKKIEEKAVAQLEENKKQFNDFYTNRLLDDAVITFKKMLYKKSFLSSIHQKTKNIGKLKCS